MRNCRGSRTQEEPDTRCAQALSDELPCSRPSASPRCNIRRDVRSTEEIDCAERTVDYPQIVMLPHLALSSESGARRVLLVKVLREAYGCLFGDLGHHTDPYSYLGVTRVDKINKRLKRTQVHQMGPAHSLFSISGSR